MRIKDSEMGNAKAADGEDEDKVFLRLFWTCR